MQLVHRYTIVILIVVIFSAFLLFINSTFKQLSYSHYFSNQPLYSESIKISTTASTNQRCRFHSCFDLHQCKPNVNWTIKVAVYPYINYVSTDEKKIFPELSYEFNSIVNAIKNSRYYTSNISEACLFVPVVDILSENGLDLQLASSALSHLSRWNKSGQNHLLFNFFPNLPLPTNTATNLRLGNSLMVSTNLLSPNYRQGYDISIPLFNSLTVKNAKKHLIQYREQRQWEIIISQLSMRIEHRKILRRVEDSGTSVLMLRQCLGTPVNSIHQTKVCKDGLPFVYPNVLQDGTFCLILPSHYYGTTLLLDAMMMGCIPVIVMDDYILPFHDVIDWKRACVQVREYDLNDVGEILSKLDDDEIANMRYQVFWLWKRYFSTIDQITVAVLDVLNDRVFENKKRSYEDWNGPFGSLQNDQYKIGASPPLFLPLQPSSTQGFTAVILTYNRVNMLQVLMKKLDQVPSLAKLVIVWNNPYLQPYSNEWPKLTKPWSLVKMKTNRLTNRFYPFKEIETEAVMAIDDDILMLTVDEIEFAFQAWREFPDRLVGFPARNHIIGPSELINGHRMKYKYESEWQNQLSMVLTGAAFYHRLYNHWFTYMMPVETKDYIDEKMNCEDIAMNFLITNLTSKAPIKVTPRKRFKCAQCNGNDSLWSESSHFIKRSECLSAFTKHFRRMPLQPVEYRIDPLLFQENLPLEIKQYPNVGTV